MKTAKQVVEGNKETLKRFDAAVAESEALLQQLSEVAPESVSRWSQEIMEVAGCSNQEQAQKSDR